MLSVSLTPNFTGVRIQGSHADLDQLVDAFYALTIDEYDSKHMEYNQISTRALGVCYDIRHAAMGDREIVLVDNGMNRDMMKLTGQITPEQNVEYACNILYPEMCYISRRLALEPCAACCQEESDHRHLRAYVCFAADGTTIEDLVRIAGIGWTVETSFAESKSQVGMDQYEVRTQRPGQRVTGPFAMF